MTLAALPVILAQAEPFLPPPVKMGPSVMRDTALVVGAIGAVILLIVLYINFFHKMKGERTRRHRHSGSGTGASADGEAASGEGGTRVRRRKRKRRREHRPRNPTLAETGGLPPMRPEDQPPRGT